MKVKWSPYARTVARDTARRIRDEFGWKVKQNFLQELSTISHLLGKYPNLGPIEPLLADAPRMYRCFVVGHLNKIIYHVGDDAIEIVDLWDTRMEPTSCAAAYRP